MKQAQSQLKLVDTAADKHTAYQRQKKTKEIYYEIEHEIPAFIKEDPYGLIGVNENLLADNFDQQEPASNIYSDDVALYSLKRLVQHRSWKTCYIRKSRKIHFKTGKKRTGVRRTSLWEMWNSEHGKLAGIHCQLLDEYLLRGEPTLKEYWQLRDACRTTDAVAALKNDVGEY